MKPIKEGTRWNGGDKIFVVISEVETEGHTWIHYREENKIEPREYSCYKESFVQRFRQLPD